MCACVRACLYVSVSVCLSVALLPCFHSAIVCSLYVSHIRSGQSPILVEGKHSNKFYHSTVSNPRHNVLVHGQYVKAPRLYDHLLAHIMSLCMTILSRCNQLVTSIEINSFHLRKHWSNSISFKQSASSYSVNELFLWSIFFLLCNLPILSKECPNCRPLIFTRRKYNEHFWEETGSGILTSLTIMPGKNCSTLIVLSFEIEKLYQLLGQLFSAKF